MNMDKRKNNSATKEESGSKRTKYNVKKDTSDRTFNGIVFDSAVEMRYYRDVVLPLLDDGSLVHCERQKRYILQPSFAHNDKKILPIEYKADFYTIDKTGKETVIDIKGHPDAVALLKRKMFWYTYPDVDYVWVGYSRIDGGFVAYETILAGRKERKKLKQKSKESKEQ